MASPANDDYERGDDTEGMTMREGTTGDCERGVVAQRQWASGGAGDCDEVRRGRSAEQSNRKKEED